MKFKHVLCYIVLYSVTLFIFLAGMYFLLYSFQENADLFEDVSIIILGYLLFLSAFDLLDFFLPILKRKSGKIVKGD